MQKIMSKERAVQEVLFNEELLFAILDYCDETTRDQSGTFISKRHCELLTSEASFKWRCEQYHREYGIYHPPILSTASTTETIDNESPSTFHHSSWRELYFKHRTYKQLWIGSNSGKDDKRKDDHTFHIQVCARFKPKNILHDTENNDRNAYKKKVTLPLHQRLALIRMNRNLASNKEALQVLKSQGSWFRGKDYDEDENKVTMSTSDNKSDASSLSANVQLLDTKHNSAIIVDRIKGLREFTFDAVVNDTVPQKCVYERSTMPLVTDFINGFNATCIVYGQTGSGKTHTMFGPHNNATDEDASVFDVCQHSIMDTDNNTNSLPESWGVIPRTCCQVMNALEFRSPQNVTKNINLHIESQLSISYIEIYGNDVNDLLRNGKPCGHSKVSAQRYVLDGSSEMKVNSLNDILELLNQGEKQKRIASTNMNERSSRAHSLFILTLRQKCITNSDCNDEKIRRNQKTSRFILADLGGSEQIKKSQPFQPNDEGHDGDCGRKDRLRETVNINLGLLALKQCVKALRSNHKHRNKPKVVPYADSKLTMLLSSGLGRDNSKTSIIVCASQHEDHVHETIDAMKFGQICKGIHLSLDGKRKSTHQMLQDLLATINSRIQECEEKIKQHERWETKNQKYFDAEGNFVETKQTTVVVGAEEYRRQLEQLLQQKMELTGDKVYNNLLYGHGNHDNDRQRNISIKHNDNQHGHS